MTSAPHAAFTESGVSGVSLAFLPASPEAAGETSPGELFVVNRGPKGWGYWRCRRCEYAAAATEPKNLQGPKAKHHDPRSGAECLSTALNWPVHLGHLFRTDVRQIRLGRPLPPPEVVTDRDDTREAFVRTLVEAVRLTAAELLAVDLRELRATWMMHGSSPDIVLYDGVTGGAGYAHRIGGEVSARRLLEKIRARLDCECAAACRKCLFDYTNQRYWDALDRRPVLAWLNELLTEAGSGDALAALGATPWTTPSLSGLRERLAGTTEVLLYAPRWLEADEGQTRRPATSSWICCAPARLCMSGAPRNCRPSARNRRSCESCSSTSGHGYAMARSGCSPGRDRRSWPSAFRRGSWQGASAHGWSVMASHHCSRPCFPARSPSCPWTKQARAARSRLGSVAGKPSTSRRCSPRARFAPLI